MGNERRALDLCALDTLGDRLHELAASIAEPLEPRRLAQAARAVGGLDLLDEEAELVNELPGAVSHYSARNEGDGTERSSRR